MLTGLSAAFAVVMTAFAVSADVAAACSCSDRDERDRLESGEKAIIGRVLAERAIDEDRQDFAYRVRVERTVGVRLSGEIELRLEDFGACGNPLVGRREGIFIRRRAGGWLTDGCSIVEASALERALRPYARPLGTGRAALLAGGRFGDARVMALDLRGRVIGYGAGRGETREISVCPGARRAAELVVDRRAARVALRDLGSLKVVRSAVLPVPAARLEPGRGWLNCADADGTAVHVAVADYIQRRRFDRIRIFRSDASGLSRVATLEGSLAAIGPAVAYVAQFGKAVVAVDLTTGATRRVTGAHGPDPLTVSPDGARIAFNDSQRLRVVDVATGHERSRRVSYGGVIEWLDAELLLFRSGGTTLAFNTQLERLRRYAFVRMLHQAQAAGRLFGTARYRLRSLNLETGRRRTVAQLTDRGITDLVGVPGRPQIQPGGQRPDSAPASTADASRPRCGVRAP